MKTFGVKLPVLTVLPPTNAGHSDAEPALVDSVHPATTCWLADSEGPTDTEEGVPGATIEPTTGDSEEHCVPKTAE